MTRIKKVSNGWAVQVYHTVGSKDGFWHTVKIYATKKEAMQ